MKKTIQLPEYEIMRLRKLYREEYENTILRLDQLKEILKDFDGDVYPVEKREKVQAKSNANLLNNSQLSVLTSNTAEVKEVSGEKIPKKRGRKPNHLKELEAKNAEKIEAAIPVPQEKKKRGRPKGTKVVTEPVSTKFDIEKLNWKKFIKSNLTRRNQLIQINDLVKLAIDSYSKTGVAPELIEAKINKTVDTLVSKGIFTKLFVNNIENLALKRWVAENGEVMVKYNPYLKLEKENKKSEINNYINQNPIASEIRKEILHFIQHNPTKNQLVITSEFYDQIINNKKIIHNNSEIETKGIIDHVLDLLIRAEEIISLPLKNGEGVQFGMKNWLKKGNDELKSYYMTR